MEHDEPVGAAGTGLIDLYANLTADLAAIWTDVFPTGARGVLHYESTSAFAFVAQPDISRDVLDSSAVAGLADLAVPAMMAQLTSRIVSFDSGEGQTGSDPGPTGAVRALPATAAAREAVEHGVTALARGLPDEAEGLFALAMGLAPLDPFARFGAAVTAYQLGSPVTAAGHLAAAGIYLMDDDPAGACYTAILAAGLHYGHGTVADAVEVLEVARDALAPVACPALSLHLAHLLRPGTSAQLAMAAALGADPLVQADLLTLPTDADAGVVRERHAAVEAEIAALDESLGWFGAAPGPVAGSAPGLNLVAAEATLARRISDCEDRLAASAAEVADLVAAREAAERDWRDLFATASAGLDHRTLLPSLLGQAVAVVATIVVGLTARLLIRTSPPWGPLVAMLAGLGLLGLLVGSWWLSLRFMRSGLEFGRAEAARYRLPAVRAEVAASRQAEFEARRRDRIASQDTVVKLSAIRSARRALVPHCPRFEPILRAGDVGRTRLVAGID